MTWLWRLGAKSAWRVVLVCAALAGGAQGCAGNPKPLPPGTAADAAADGSVSPDGSVGYDSGTMQDGSIQDGAMDASSDAGDGAVDGGDAGGALEAGVDAGILLKKDSGPSIPPPP